MAPEDDAPSHLSRRGLFGSGIARLLSEGRALSAQLGRGRVPFEELFEDEPEPLDEPDYKELVRQAFADGDPRPFGRLLEPVADALLQACPVAPGDEVLDVGAGDGNVALATARAGASVTACDLVPQQVVRGRRRGEEAGLEIDWVVGDIEALPFQPNTFACVLFSLGTVYAPSIQLAFEKLFRVVRPGGAVGLATWAETGFMGEALALACEYAALPRDVELPTAWGRYETLHRHLTHHAPSFDSQPRTLRLELESREAVWELLAEPPGPLAFAAAGLTRAEAADLREELLTLAARQGPGGGDDRPTIDAEYLLTVARHPG